MLKTLLKPFASLTLTVILLSLSMVLIYAGTLAQVDMDVWKVQHQYFHQLIAWIRLQDFVPRFSSRPAYIPGEIPFPGGYLIGSLLLINLIAAHSVRFKFSPKDVLLLPQALIIGTALYFWQTHYNPWLLLTAVVFGALFIITLFLVHSKRAGVIIIHLGLILLLVGEGITSRAAKEMRMDIQEGSYASFVYDIRTPELAIVDKSAPDRDAHVVIPASLLKNGTTLDDPRLPFQVKVDKYFANSHEVLASKEPSQPSITDENGPAWTVTEVKGVSGVQGGQVDLPSVFVTLSKNGKTIGSYLFTVMTRATQVVNIDGKRYELSLRFQREYKPYTITLNKFSFDRYTGTNVPRNYSSDVSLADHSNDEHRDIRIWMNHPLRYAGETFYQSGFDEKTEKATVLQVVRNPAMTLPYTAIIIAAIGLIVHFGVTLVNFLSRRDLSGAELALGLVALLAAVIVGSIAVVVAGWLGLLIVIVGAGMSIGAIMLVRGGGRESAPITTPPPLPKPARGKKKPDDGRYELAPQSIFFSARFLVPTLILGLCLFYVVGHAVTHPLSPNYDMDSFARLPLSYEGRVQPMDSLARNALKVMRGRESALLIEKDKDGKDEEKTIQPVPWLLDVLTDKEIAIKYKVFVIDHPDVKGYLKLDEHQKYFSVEDLLPAQEQLTSAFNELNPIRQNKGKSLTPYQAALLEVCDRATLYSQIRSYLHLKTVPPASPGADWISVFEAAQKSQQTGQRDEVAAAYLRTLQAYADAQPASFNAEVRNYQQQIERRAPRDIDRVAFEAWYNRFDPITISLVFYIGVFILAAFSWMGFSKPLARAAFWVLLLTMVIHTFGLAARIYMSGRPPVTNLASSAIFIGWGMVVFAICLELIYKNGIGSVLAAVAGFPTLIIARQLSLEGDTMKVLQAVLDTNVWLGSHVVCITMGYAATFLAGLIGIAYVVLGVFTPLLDGELKKTMGRMMYGITCFALLFSFVGTILGGLWADQSWGRFWGWDPKENGAILIVLANALFLHARWGGLVKERGMANIAIFGNIITAWSYFGTNMLGVGLHSYGFMASAVAWLNAFIGSQIFFILLGTFIPIGSWQSFARVSEPAKPQNRA